MDKKAILIFVVSFIGVTIVVFMIWYLFKIYEEKEDENINNTRASKIKSKDIVSVWGKQLLK